MILKRWLQTTNVSKVSWQCFKAAGEHRQWSTPKNVGESRQKAVRLFGNCTVSWSEDVFHTIIHLQITVTGECRWLAA